MVEKADYDEILIRVLEDPQEAVAKIEVQFENSTICFPKPFFAKLPNLVGKKRNFNTDQSYSIHMDVSNRVNTDSEKGSFFQNTVTHHNGLNSLNQGIRNF